MELYEELKDILFAEYYQARIHCKDCGYDLDLATVSLGRVILYAGLRGEFDDWLSQQGLCL